MPRHTKCSAGGLIWLALDGSGIHATLTGVLLGLMTPTRVWVSDRRLHAILDRIMLARPRSGHRAGDTPDRRGLQLVEAATREALSPVERLEIALHPWVGFAIMPLFAFANAGVPISVADLRGSVAMSVFAGFVFGKPVGVLTLSWVAVRLGLATRPPELSWGMLAAGSLLTGIGFTMALFIANAAFSHDLLNGAKLGILSASIVSAAVGILVLTWLTTKSGSADLQVDVVTPTLVGMSPAGSVLADSNK
jgi:NhaA family Na+:H+ antiporter